MRVLLPGNDHDPGVVSKSRVIQGVDVRIPRCRVGGCTLCSAEMPATAWAMLSQRWRKRRPAAAVANYGFPLGAQPHESSEQARLPLYARSLWKVFAAPPPATRQWDDPSTLERLPASVPTLC